MIQQGKYYSIEYLLNDKDKPILFITLPRGSGRKNYLEFRNRLEYLNRGFWGLDITKGVYKHESNSI